MASEASELTTFGSLIRFALELEVATAAFYDGAGELIGPDGPQALFRELATQHAERRRLLERTRQQKLNEMVLEPITGLDGHRYVYDASVPSRDQLRSRAGALEAVAALFYEESSVVAKYLLTEASRTLQRLAEENHRNEARLKGSS